MSGGAIVCVDDQPEVRRLLAEVFGSRDRAVQAFADGDSAEAWIAEHAVDLVVLDLDLGPGRRGGLEVCRSLHARHPELPVIILTGHGGIDDAIEAVKALSLIHI